MLCLSALAPINRLLKIGRQDGWFINSRGTTLYLLVHVQFGHDINFTVALKNLNFSKDQTLAHFEDFSIYQHISDSRASPPLWAFLSGMQENPNQKSDWWTNPLRNNFDCIHHYCETPLLFEWNLPPNWRDLKLILVGWWELFFHFRDAMVSTSWMISWYHRTSTHNDLREFFEAECMDLGPPENLRKHFEDSLLWCCPNSRCFHPKGWHFFFTRKMHASQSLEDMRNLTLGKICQTCAAWSISPLILCPWLHFHPCSRGEKPYFKLKAIEKETPSVRRWRCLDFGKFRKCLTFWLCKSSFGKTAFIQTAGSPVNLPPFKWSCVGKEIEGGSCVSSQGNIFAWGCTLLHFGSPQFFAAEEKEPRKAMAATA